MFIEDLTTDIRNLENVGKTYKDTDLPTGAVM